MSGLGNDYHPSDYSLFDFHLTSSNAQLRTLAASMVDELQLKTGRLDNVKVDLMVCMLANLFHSSLTWKCMAISRRPDWYAKIPKQNGLPIQSYKFVTATLDVLENAGLIVQHLGYHSEDEGHLTKIHPTDALKSQIAFLRNSDLGYILPDEIIELRDADGNALEYRETQAIKAMKSDTEAYNDLLNNSTVELRGLNSDDLSQYNTEYLFKYTFYNNDSTDTVRLRPMRVRRIFNHDFDHGGRFYGGIENMPSVLRPKITIGGQPTVELDYSAYQLRMLYHMKGINYRKDAYAVAHGYREELRPIYKIIALAALNAENEQACVKGIRNELRNTTYADMIGRINNARIKPLLMNWVNAHAPIEEYMYTGIGLELQKHDSDIAARVLSYFQRKNVLVLSVHDSFLIESAREKELRSEMRKIYKAKFGFYPVIK